MGHVAPEVSLFPCINDLHLGFLMGRVLELESTSFGQHESH